MPTTAATTPAYPLSPSPNWIVDEVGPTLGDAAYRVLHYIARRTVGFHRTADSISLEQFQGGIVTRDGRRLDSGCGVRSRSAIIRALRELEERGIIARLPSVQATGRGATLRYALTYTPATRPTQTVLPAHPERVTGDDPQTEVVEESSDTSTIPLPPPPASQVAAPPQDPAAACAPLQQTEGVMTAAEVDTVVMAQTLADLSRELADDTPASTLTQIERIMLARALPPARMLALLAEARERTLQYADNIRRLSRTQPGRRNMMPYLLTTLASLLADPPPVARHANGLGRPHGRRPAREAPPVLLPPSPPAITEPHEVWRALLDELGSVWTPENFARWLAPTHVVREDGETLTIAVPGEFERHWLADRLHGRVQSALERLGYGALKVEYVVAGG